MTLEVNCQVESNKLCVAATLASANPGLRDSSFLSGVRISQNCQLYNSNNILSTDSNELL